MNIQQNKELVRQHNEEIWNRHQLEKLAQFVDTDLLSDVIEHTRQFLTAFPDVRVIIEDLIGEGDKVVGRLLVSGTNTGPFAGFPPTGKKIQFSSFRIYRIAGGKIVETWAMQDRLVLLEQLGRIQSVDGVDWASGEKERPEKG